MILCERYFEGRIQAKQDSFHLGADKIAMRTLVGIRYDTC